MTDRATDRADDIQLRRVGEDAGWVVSDTTAGLSFERKGRQTLFVKFENGRLIGTTPALPESGGPLTVSRVAGYLVA
jgi:hypothetical protein